MNREAESRRFLLPFLVATFIILAQVAFLQLKIPPISPSDYQSTATHLSVVGPWRIGFVQTPHGARFIRTRADTFAGANLETDNNEVPDFIRDFMSRELRLLPWKAIGEGLFYLSLFYLFFAPLRQFVHARFRGLWRRGVSYSILTFLFCLMSALPLVLFHYDSSVYTDWEGPGAFGMTVTRRVTLLSGITLSYRTYLEVIGLTAVRIGTILGLEAIGGLGVSAFFLGFVSTINALMAFSLGVLVEACAPLMRCTSCPFCNERAELPWNFYLRYSAKWSRPYMCPKCSNISKLVHWWNLCSGSAKWHSMLVVFACSLAGALLAGAALSAFLDAPPLAALMIGVGATLPIVFLLDRFLCRSFGALRVAQKPIEHG